MQTPHGSKARLAKPPFPSAAVLVLNDDWCMVRTSPPFGKRQRRVAERAFCGHAADQPLGSTTTGAMVDFMLMVDGVISSLFEPQCVAKSHRHRHGSPLEHRNGSAGRRFR